MQLRVHHEGPTLAGSENGGVLTGHPVSRQPLVLPSCNVCVIRQHGQRVQVRGHWDGNLTDGIDECVFELCLVLSPIMKLDLYLTSSHGGNYANGIDALLVVHPLIASEQHDTHLSIKSR